MARPAIENRDKQANDVEAPLLGDREFKAQTRQHRRVAMRDHPPQIKMAADAACDTVPDSSGNGGMTLYVRRNAVLSGDGGGGDGGSGATPVRPPGADAEDAVAQFWSAAEAGVIELPQEVFHDTMAGAMHGVVNEAVQQAVTAAMTEQAGFNITANLFTLFAITGVIFFWRGVWTLWDALVGMSVGSGVLCLCCGLVMMMAYGIIRSRWEREEEQEASKDGSSGSGSGGTRQIGQGHHHQPGQMDCFL